MAGGDDGGHVTSPGRERRRSRVLLYQLVDGRLDDVGEALGLDNRGDYSTLIADDIDGDGWADLLVGGFRQLPRLYLNRLERRGSPLVIELVGASAFDAELVIDDGRRVTTVPRGVTRSAPWAIGRAAVLTGVDSTGPVAVTVRWPEGDERYELTPRPAPWRLSRTE